MNEVYKAIFDRLVAILTNNVYGHVPQDLADSEYPFVRLDPIQSTNQDTDDKSGFAATIQVIGFSRYRGSLEIENLADDVYSALQRYAIPDTANFGISSITESFRTIATQPDGLTRNSIQQYELIFEPL